MRFVFEWREFKEFLARGSHPIGDVLVRKHIFVVQLGKQLSYRVIADNPLVAGLQFFF